MKKPYRALDFQLKTSLLPGKIDSYKGPVNSREISRQVALEAKEKGIDITGDEVRFIAGLFFNRAQFYMRKKDFVIVDGLGSFGMTPKKRKDVDKEDEIEYERKVRLMRYTRYREYRKSKVKKDFELFNAKRVAKGLKPWRWKEYRGVHKPKIPKRLHPRSVLKKK